VLYLRKQLKVILLATLFLLSVPMVGNASSLTIHEVPIYSDSVKKSDELLGSTIVGADVDLSFLSESNTVLTEEQYLEKWNKHNPDYKASKVIIVEGNVEDGSNSVSPSQVIGTDNRTKVSNINVTPHQQTVYLESIYFNAYNELKVFRCSGSFFQDNLGRAKVLTAAHCMHKGNHPYDPDDEDEDYVRGYALGIAIFKGMRDGGTYDDYTSATAIKIPSEFVNVRGAAYDIGVITMQDNLSEGVGTLDLENATSRTVRIGGYPYEVRGVKGLLDQYQMTGIASLSGGTLTYTIDTTGGQSGTPVLNVNTHKVIGVHSRGNPTINTAAALNSVNILFIKQ